MEGLNVDEDGLFKLPKDYFVEDIRESTEFLHNQVGRDLPAVIDDELRKQAERINAM